MLTHGGFVDVLPLRELGQRLDDRLRHVPDSAVRHGLDGHPALAAGFVGLLGLDWSFWRQGLAPEWWMRLRILLTAIVVLCLMPLVL